jgi:hypothetical protein
MQSAREDEMLPEINEEQFKLDLENLKINKNKIKVFTDMKAIEQNLTDDKFNFVDDLNKADIIFIRKHFKDYKY